MCSRCCAAFAQVHIVLHHSHLYQPWCCSVFSQPGGLQCVFRVLGLGCIFSSWHFCGRSLMLSDRVFTALAAHSPIRSSCSDLWGSMVVRLCPLCMVCCLCHHRARCKHAVQVPRKPAGIILGHHQVGMHRHVCECSVPALACVQRDSMSALSWSQSLSGPALLCVRDAHQVRSAHWDTCSVLAVVLSFVCCLSAPCDTCSKPVVAVACLSME